MEFNGATNFTEFLASKPEIKEILPWSEELIFYCGVINKGCGCTKQKRIDRAEGVYINLVKEIIIPNKDIQHFMKKFSGEDKFIFKAGDSVIAEF
jgi:hypothetical protein